MKLAFFLAAAVMIAVALALLLLPLIRQGRRQGRSRGVFVLALLVAFVVPLSAAGLYLAVGTPAALDGVKVADANPSMTIDEAVAQLRQHLVEKPDDIQGWLLLGRTYSEMKKPDEARDAYDRVLKLDPNVTGAMIGWAEADSIARTDHRIEGRSRDLLERAVQIEPDNQRGLWLLGISDFQLGQYIDAANTWRRLQPLLDPGSSVAKAVQEQIAVAEARAGGKAPSETEAAPAGASLEVRVTLSPALKEKLAPGATLFVYARAEQGPPMPLAVARLDATALPATVTLTDAMAMTPQLKLSTVPRVFVGARISSSGQAIAQSGDLEGDAGVVAVDSKTPVSIIIDKVH
ncbi:MULTISPECIES: tetratricopeptide repeat protein [Dyella]|uniref:Tetratricopeptide repeat protein n=2 Tax=Dyella TaxID=231454 RepID=A0A4R0Z0X4_9GAMM|nr:MULTISPECIES: tetratricopeptide repeat protein [Dyella]TBR39139.1 tetratricopeptide repeat protein [Dyella terrae]TCI13274.1 tetratricopeptide repeat protein [Dyella soli]